MEPSPALRHNLIRQRIAERLTQFVRAHRLGVVVEEMDFRLATDTVRNPDVAFITNDHLRNIDPDHSPVEGAPTLAIEVISPTNLAQDMAKKVRQYLEGVCQAVWLIYPALRLVEIHDSAGARRISEPESIVEAKLFPALIFQYLSPHCLTTFSNSRQSFCDVYFVPCPLSALPPIAPVAFPFSNATCPLTSTYFTPTGSCAGSV